MAKETNTDTVRQELIRLLDGLECYRQWRISCLERDKGVVIEDDLNQVVLPSSFFLQIFDETKGRGSSAVMKEIRQWYSHTSSDLFYIMNSGDVARASDVRRFLDKFRTEVGFDFFAESGLLRKVVNKVLKLNRISSQVDYYSLKELENDQSQSIVSSEELAEIHQLIREFENGAHTR